MLGLKLVSRVTLFASLLAVPVAPAVAADQLAAAPDIPAYTWSGAYVGGDVGYRFNGGYKDEFGDHYYTKGMLGGVFIGYNWQVQNYVFGAEGDWNWTGNSLKDTNFATGFSSSLDDIATIRGRAGISFDRFLIYGTAGVAFARQTYDGPSFSVSKWHTGWAAGLGGEAFVTQNLTFRAEYLHVDPGKATYNIGLGDFDADIKGMDIFRIGVAYKFN